MIEHRFRDSRGDSERERTTPQPNMVEKMMSEHFASSEHWRGKERIVNKTLFGLDPFGRLRGKDIIVEQSKTWLASLYGIRLVPVPGHEDEVTLEWTTLNTVRLIHEKLAETVLSGEDIRVATLVTPPAPEEGINNPANNTFWVEQHAKGIGPILSKVKDPRETPEDYDDHDYSSAHLINNALFPQEGQRLFTATSKYELAWLKRFEKGEVSEKELLLPGEKRGDFSEFVINYARGSYDGTRRMDFFSACLGYTDLLAFVVDEASVSPQERLDIVKAYVASQEYTGSGLGEARMGYHSAYENVVALVDFNTRHREGRNATWEEADQEFDNFMTGVVRVATKIRGS